MKPFNTFLIGGWSLLLSLTALARHTPAFPNSISNCNYVLSDLMNKKPKTHAIDTPYFADDDKDGVSNAEDCAPNNPNLPAKPGTLCNDNDDFTKDDKVQEDGCTCIGTTTKKDSPITIDLGDDRFIGSDETIIISTSVLQYNTCIVTTCKEESPLIAHWNVDDINKNSLVNNTDDYSKFVNTASDNSFCANIVTKGLYRLDELGLIPTTSYSAKAKKAVMADMPLVSDFQNNHPKALRFDVVMDPTADVSRINKLTFMEQVPATAEGNSTNNAPTKYGIRVLKGGKEIYKSIDMMTSKKWSEAVFDFTNEPIFEVSSTTVFTIELLAYGQNNDTTNNSFWNIDDIKIYGGCCNTSSFQSSRYLWSTGERTNSISVKNPGSYVVTVTDCNGTTAVDEVVVKQQ